MLQKNLIFFLQIIVFRHYNLYIDYLMCSQSNTNNKQYYNLLNMQRRINRVDKQISQTNLEYRNPYEKKYTVQQMKVWCEKFIESRLKVLYKQIDENNEQIKILSQKLRLNENELEKKQKQLQAIHNKGYSYTKSDVIQITNKLINDKLKQKYQDINKLIQNIESNKQDFRKISQQQLADYQYKMQDRLNRKIYQLKNALKQRIEEIKNSNAQYWNKIKSWAKLFQDRLSKCQQAIQSLYSQNMKFNDESKQSLLQLYKLKNIGTRIQQLQSVLLQIEQSYKLIGQTQFELKSLVEKNQSNVNLQLSYSKDDITYKINNDNNEELPQFKSQEKKRSQSQQFQFTRKDRFSENVDMKQSKMTKLSPLNNDYSQLSNVKSDHSNERSRAISLKSMLSITSESRKQMATDLRKRLLELIQQKKLEVPIPCYMDDINYLKNSRNNYIFDSKGNMFKIKADEFMQLCNENILKKI